MAEVLVDTNILVRHLTDQPRELADGGVQVEWRGPRADLELEIRAMEDLAYLFVDRHGDERRFEEADDVSWSGAVDLVARALSD